MRIADTPWPVGHSTAANQPADLGARCIGARLVAMARAAAAMHQVEVARRVGADSAQRTAVGEARS
mgnify:CR=1 FL=1